MTVLYLWQREKFLISVHCFHVLTIPLRKEFHTDRKTDLKKLLTIRKYRKGMKFLIELSGKITMHIIKTEWKKIVQI
jgi:hypothetical protein